MSTPSEVRKATLDWLRVRGIPLAPELPFLEEDLRIRRSIAETSGRVFCLHLIAARSAGCPQSVARRFIDEQALESELTEGEIAYLEEPKDIAFGNDAIESLWALAWSTSAYPQLDFSAPSCPDDLIDYMPSLVNRAVLEEFRRGLHYRLEGELIQELDKSYCMDWVSTETAMRAGPGAVAVVSPNVTGARRRSLEWLFSEERWDTIALDT